MQNPWFEQMAGPASTQAATAQCICQGLCSFPFLAFFGDFAQVAGESKTVSKAGVHMLCYQPTRSLRPVCWSNLFHVSMWSLTWRACQASCILAPPNALASSTVGCCHKRPIMKQLTRLESCSCEVEISGLVQRNQTLRKSEHWVPLLKGEHRLAHGK